MKKYNFNAGPSMLPREVIENTAKQILDFNGSGLIITSASPTVIFSYGPHCISAT